MARMFDDRGVYTEVTEKQIASIKQHHGLKRETKCRYAYGTEVAYRVKATETYIVIEHNDSVALSAAKRRAAR